MDSSRNKYEMFAGFIENFIIFLISKSKLDNTFPDKQFCINDFKIFRCDCNRQSGGLILYAVKEIIWKPSKIALFDLNISTIGLEFHQIKRLQERTSRLLILQLFNLNAVINSRTLHHSHILNHIDQILTNQNSLFKLSKAFETGLSDHRRLISTTIKSGSFLAAINQLQQQ